MEEYPIELVMKITLNSAETYIEPGNFIGALLDEVIQHYQDYGLLQIKEPSYKPNESYWYALGQTNIIEYLAYDLGIDRKQFKKTLKHHNEKLFNIYKNELKLKQNENSTR